MHRDAKPANLMLAAGGTLKVLDLGLARLDESPDGSADHEAGLTRAGTALGTVGWMAPELADDARSSGPPADVYGLGCVLHYLLTGRSVYGGRSAVETLLAHRRDAIPSLRAGRPEIPEALESLFNAAVAKRPESRPAMRELEEGLARFRLSPSGWASPLPGRPRATELPGASAAGSQAVEHDSFGFAAEDPVELWLRRGRRDPGALQAWRRRIETWFDSRTFAVSREAVPLPAAGAVLVLVLIWLAASVAIG